MYHSSLTNYIIPSKSRRKPFGETSIYEPSQNKTILKQPPQNRKKIFTDEFQYYL